jgi:hypothetical protein
LVAKLGKDSVWSDNEIGNCCLDVVQEWGTNSYKPASLWRVTKQLELSSMVAKRVVWIAQYQMTKVTGGQMPGSERLLASYKAYRQIEGKLLKPQSYSWQTQPLSTKPDTANIKLFDEAVGDPKSSSNSAWVGTNGKAQFTLAFDKPYKIDWIGVHQLEHYSEKIRISDVLTIECSDDAASWSQIESFNRSNDLGVAESTNTNSAVYSEFVFSNPNGHGLNANCRYLRITLDKPGVSNYKTYISEVEIVGDDAAVVATPPPAPSCDDFKGGSVNPDPADPGMSPGVVKAGSSVRVTCDFGRADIDCIARSLKPINFDSCVFTGIEGTTAVFSCKAPKTPGEYELYCGLFTTADCPAPNTPCGIKAGDVAVTGILGDFNTDGVVNIQDFVVFSSKFGTSDSSTDLNHDGVVNIQDFVIFSSHFGETGS